MTDTFRALCAELLDVIDSLPSETNYRNQSRCVFPIDEDVVFRARAALQQPEPQTPSKSELFDLLMQSGGDNRAFSNEWLEPFAQAILARWGK